MNATTQDQPGNPNYAAQCATHARAHADKAEALVKKSDAKVLKNMSVEVRIERASHAAAHATLALFWQGEAGRS